MFEFVIKYWDYVVLGIYPLGIDSVWILLCRDNMLHPSIYISFNKIYIATKRSIYYHTYILQIMQPSMWVQKIFVGYKYILLNLFHGDEL